MWLYSWTQKIFGKMLSCFVHTMKVSGVKCCFRPHWLSLYRLSLLLSPALMFSFLLAMKTRNSNGGYKVNDPALLSQYKSPLLGQPSLSGNFYDPSMSSFTNQAHPFRHHLHSKKRGHLTKQGFTLLFNKKPLCASIHHSFSAAQWF